MLFCLRVRERVCEREAAGSREKLWGSFAGFTPEKVYQVFRRLYQNAVSMLPGKLDKEQQCCPLIEFALEGESL